MSSPQYQVGGYRVSRRRFVAALGAGWATATATAAGVAAAQQVGVPVESPSPNQVTGAAVTQPETPGASMEGDGYRPVQRPPKPGASPSMDAMARDDLEHKISCPCPCTLDVFTCRTSMPCGFSPRMHSDVMALVEGGYSADEILAAFEQEYGQQVLMAPKKEGFNLAGYLMPFAALGTGAVVVAALIRKWGRRAAAVQAAEGRVAPAASHGLSPADVGATPDEMARLEAAVRGESR
ncbi:cytochrome c-type biogenesis protein CcmH [Roseisolibacter sp. H3M3-2]|uniref:cytochrome c-type biogenesis protein CcmH n=1 Tax=Roseisolibacter sp. H3M3-2 TaxID=3031323 RepID=UPI0023D9EB68|nr:cytochrome c-type biogenesis protein CcmH [Roseisolibacter sp. H3M3-2]MDF1503207.1 cytochrome c-type biogenesis protein CcmH [Roseisolibacter sp. H3M3-2]